MRSDLTNCLPGRAALEDRRRQEDCMSKFHFSRYSSHKALQLFRPYVFRTFRIARNIILIFGKRFRVDGYQLCHVLCYVIQFVTQSLSLSGLIWKFILLRQAVPVAVGLQCKDVKWRGVFPDHFVTFHHSFWYESRHGPGTDIFYHDYSVRRGSYEPY